LSPLVSAHYNKHTVTNPLAPRGVSIVEALAAGFVLTIVLMTLLDLLPASLLAVSRARHTETATNLARSLIEDRRAAGFGLFDTPPTLTPLVEDGTTFVPQFQVVDVSAQANPARVKAIRVVVVWQEHGGLRSLSQELWLAYVP
jgi:Tfp pilus assembly protein PilV